MISKNNEKSRILFFLLFKKKTVFKNKTNKSFEIMCLALNVYV